MLIAPFYLLTHSKATPEIPETFITNKFIELQQTMRETHGGEWKSALIQITRAANKVSTHFEYKDGDRWKVTPSNLEAMREELRPK